MSAPPHPTDPDLVRGLHRRDRSAVTRLYDDYHPAVYNLCARILGDREEAKDVTQDVFLTAFERPPAKGEDVRLRAWLFRVATNACLNRLRSRRRTEPIEENVASAGDPFEQARTAGFIEAGLAALNERYRAVLVLKDLQGLETRELAEVLGVSRPAADVLVHRARASFRRAFVAAAGDDAAVPANLALALPPLPVPAALQALPLALQASPALPAGAPGFDPSTAAHVMPLDPGAAAGAGAAAPAAGLLAKLGAAATTKAAVVAAGAALVAGGGAAAVKLSGGAPTPPSPAPVAAGRTGPETPDGHSRTDDRHEHRALVAARLADHHAADEEHEDGHAPAHESDREEHVDKREHDSADHRKTGGHLEAPGAAHDAGDAPSAAAPAPAEAHGDHRGDDGGHGGDH
ncbi:MAG: sigma-70 family RNA polymerase sigma factor [Actinobacteria bacterium]|nr:sigma-70 family RNA polymerase sigma factor [Actinomycetota bacterium]